MLTHMMPLYKKSIIIHYAPKTFGLLGWPHYINVYLIITFSAGT